MLSPDPRRRENVTARLTEEERAIALSITSHTKIGNKLERLESIVSANALKAISPRNIHFAKAEKIPPTSTKKAPTRYIR